jgi:hypothetical protein
MTRLMSARSASAISKQRCSWLSNRGQNAVLITSELRSSRRHGGPARPGDPHGPYPSSTLGNCADVGAFGASNQHLPLVANVSPFRRVDMYYDDELDERKSLRSDDCDGRSNYSSQRDEAWRTARRHGTSSRVLMGQVRCWRWKY